MTTTSDPSPQAAGLATAEQDDPAAATGHSPATGPAADTGRREPDLAAPGAGVPHPEFGRLEDWVTEYFLPMFRRTLGGEYRWCARWWRHGEAISRLTALWHAWEVLRIQPGTGIASWYRDHLDHQLPILLGARGPFYQCSEDTHREPHQPAAEPAPGGWWDIAQAQPAGDHPGAAHSAGAGAGAGENNSGPGGSGEHVGSGHDHA